MTKESKNGQKFSVLRFLTFGVLWRLPRSSAAEAGVWRMQRPEHPRTLSGLVTSDLFGVGHE